MSSIANRLHDEHAAILEMLKCIRTMCPATDEGLRKLIEAKQFILDHLALEDEHLYPALRANIQTKDLAHRFADEMDRLAPALIDFFEKYEKTPNAEGYASELGRLMALLQARISREEYLLLPALEGLQHAQLELNFQQAV